MSGTSLDGLDISYLKTDGSSIIKPIYNQTYNYSKLIKIFLKYLIQSFEKNILQDKSRKKKVILLSEILFSYYCYKKIKNFFKKFSLRNSDIDLIGFHGQTLYHNSNAKISFQLGNVKYLSNKLKIPVISKFRQADLDNNGQGAPLVPLFHQKLFSRKNKNIAVVNIGGISNLTFIEKKSKVFATDIGPGNKLIDECCQKILSKRYDFNGKFSEMGKANKIIIKQWKNKQIFKKKFPRSYNNNDFNLENFKYDYLNNPYDFLASLVDLTANLISDAINYFSNSPNYLIICGGGALNITLINKLKIYVKKPVFVSDNFGFPLEFIESQAFGYYGVRKFLDLPITSSSITGAKSPTVCGEIVYPKSFF